MAGNFALDISRWCKNAKADTKSVVQKIAMETFKRVILRSPVDTGRFRANWGVMVGSPYTGFDEAARDKRGAAAIGKAQTVTINWNAQGLITCCNNASYGHSLEYSAPGSKQAPQGMVRVTAAEIMAWAQSASNIKESISSIRSKTN